LKSKKELQRHRIAIAHFPKEKKKQNNPITEGGKNRGEGRGKLKRGEGKA